MGNEFSEFFDQISKVRSAKEEWIEKRRNLAEAASSFSAAKAAFTSAAAKYKQVAGERFKNETARIGFVENVKEWDTEDFETYQRYQFIAAPAFESAKAEEEIARKVLETELFILNAITSLTSKANLHL